MEHIDPAPENGVFKACSLGMSDLIEIAGGQRERVKSTQSTFEGSWLSMYICV